jgi:pilus assembly protein CpaF
MTAVIPDTEVVKRRVRNRLLSGSGHRELGRLTPPERRLLVRAEVMSVLREERTILPAGALTQVVNQISDEVVGLGPIERLLKDPEVSEVMVNGADDVYVERKGRIERAEGLFFEGEEQVFHLIERIVAPLGLRVDESSPYVDARLSDGSRVNAVVPPLSLCGPVVTVRKFALRPFDPDDLLRLGTLSKDMIDFLRLCVRSRASIVVSGGTGSGKTSLLGALSSFIPPEERLITIEDAAELRLAQPHVVSLEARPPNVEGAGEVTVRALVRNALRMRPDRIIVGEVRGGEALDMLQAMNTGHEGSMSTAHANSPRDLLSRLETMALMSDVDLPLMHVREQIASALDLIVHMARRPDGSRAVMRISAVEGLHASSVVLEDLFVCDRGTSGRFISTGRTAGTLQRLGVWGAAPVEATSPMSRGVGSVPPEAPEAPEHSTHDGTAFHPVDGAKLDSPPPVEPSLSTTPANWPGALRRLGSLLE